MTPRGEDSGDFNGDLSSSFQTLDLEQIEYSVGDQGSQLNSRPNLINLI